VWNIPQWYPHTSMALFAPAAGFHPLQYAGQQLPNFQQQPQQVRFCYCSSSAVANHFAVSFLELQGDASADLLVCFHLESTHAACLVVSSSCTVWSACALRQVLPMLPLVLPPALQAMIPPPPANASPEQIRNHHTAAAAAAAAAASVMAPYSHHMMMPPTIVPMTMSVQHQAAASAAVR